MAACHHLNISHDCSLRSTWVRRAHTKDPSGPGVIQPAEMSGAVKAIRAAVAADEARQKPKEEDDTDDASSSSDTVSLRVRSSPLIEMLQRCEKAGVDIVWGV